MDESKKNRRESCFVRNLINAIQRNVREKDERNKQQLDSYRVLPTLSRFLTIFNSLDDSIEWKEIEPIFISN